MATKRKPIKEQETLADALFPVQPNEEFEEAILSIAPEQRILRTEQYDFSVLTLVTMLEKGEVAIPRFQRRYVWSDRQASRLVESLIIQCPIPVIYLNQERDETFSVIDGNQRLSSLQTFLQDGFALSGLTSYPELTGLKFSELDPRFRRHIGNRVLRCTVILKETHPQVKFDVFERLNSGAVALTRQELRHGLYYGRLLQAASTVADELDLANRLGNRSDRRMKSEELVVRYWALIEGLDKYEKPLASFITNFAEAHRNPSVEKLAALQEDIRLAYERCLALFESHAFTFAKPGAAPRFNAAVFDAQMVACSGLSSGRFKALVKVRKQVAEGYEKLQKNEDFARSVTLATSDKASLQGRIRHITRLLKSS